MRHVYKEKKHATEESEECQFEIPDLNSENTEEE